jgi:hypothetical protein
LAGGNRVVSEWSQEYAGGADGVGMMRSAVIIIIIIIIIDQRSVCRDSL